MHRCILADKDIPFLDDYLPDDIRVVRFDPLNSWDQIANEHGSNAEALLVRTVSKIRSDTFPIDRFPQLRFVGTASAGFDHIDIDFLAAGGVTFMDAGGSNAQAVGEYVASVIVQWCIDHQRNPESINVGIVGAGHTGSAVNRIVSKLGASTVLYDPPKSILNPDFRSAELLEVLNCDILTFHIPLSTTGEFATQNWMHQAKFEHFSGQLLINAARGGVVNEADLLRWREQDHQRVFVLDVWDNEPHVTRALANAAWIATPHIAGYSNQSKRNATRYITEKMFPFLGVTIPAVNECASLLHMDSYRSWHPLFELSESLKSQLGNDLQVNAQVFRKLRLHSVLRNEFKYMPKGRYERLEQYPVVQQLVRVCGGPV
jgi:erythronate-4-phosphate dehydrogenase